MKTLISISGLLLSYVSFLVISSGYVYGIDKGIYGEDNRNDLCTSTNTKFKVWAQSTAAQILKDRVVSRSNGSYLIDSKSFADLMMENEVNLCSEERFREQPAAANCSGFLVGEDRLVTAGHCVTNMNDCEKMLWVFDYKVKSGSTVSDQITVSSSNVYSCKEIISQEMEMGRGKDFALIRLDRKVKDRKPLSYRRNGTISVGEQVVVIGHPSGLPTKITDGAFVRDSADPIYFVANSDTYGGNSGSVVMNVKTGLVEGILVRGDQDFEMNFEKNCYMSKRCAENDCRGEDITKITVINELL
ncbi:MAG: trypsin-like peptidase domain-containing protein [Oligoflexia bacterium]|nr:trypsin-like peptidase domain-containing protein [Oligoflexia bacterium]